ncbi:predicted protein [Plenodomus lingam JN3]|uniref:Predicted protein n=1 Tax=Leptosphaeria maculans (strain JN3 / isolate v23.1.3 / race Av1-4-5-6-7-8) TaxID=985895 RepID=E5A0A3_LEPMJ|nr:predicted protein [Plenodomus lingam JN3]CBX96963.1 predicted protein [Plenodomus lingam JN3]
MVALRGGGSVGTSKPLESNSKALGNVPTICYHYGGLTPLGPMGWVEPINVAECTEI